MPPSLRGVVVCWSSQTQSLEAHGILGKRGLSVRPLGTGACEKLPGPSRQRPSPYDYHTTYEQMYSDLLSEDKDFHTHKGILHMLARNERIQPRPESFQDRNEPFDLTDPHL